MNDWTLLEWGLAIASLAFALAFWATIVRAWQKASVREAARIDALARERQGQTAEQFARYFEERGIDAKLAAAVYALIQGLVPSTGKNGFPVHPADLIEDYGIDSEDLDFEVWDLARRRHLALPIGRSLAEGSPIRTVEDLVFFLATCSHAKRTSA